jgi:hypothetical protein
MRLNRLSGHVQELTMRDQYYGDWKDVWKWTVIAQQVATANSARIVYAAMMRPDDEQVGHGCSFGDVQGAHNGVVAFFEQERRDFALEGNVVGRPRLRRVNRIAALSGGIRNPIAFIGAQYSSTSRSYYFDSQVLPWLHVNRNQQPIVVLLDPDSGLSQAAEPNDCQLGVTELQTVWNTLQLGDVLVLHSEPGYALNALIAERNRVQGVLNAEIQVSAFPFNPNQGYLIVRRT